MSKIVNNTYSMYPYVKSLIAQVRSLKCNIKSTCLLCYCLLYGVCLTEYYGIRGWLPQYVVDSHYVVMLTNVHTRSLCMHVTSSIGHGVQKNVVLIFTTVYYYA